MNLNQFIEPLIQICEDAGQAILEVYEDPDRFSIEYKSDQSPLTAADKAANDIICEGLMSMEFSFPIISEENKEIPFTDRKDLDYCWLVDPLDGTKEFIKRNGEFTVNVALIHQRKSVLGIVYIPVTKETFYAIKGEGAFRHFKKKQARISSRPFDQTAKHLNIVCSRSHMNEDTKRFINRFPLYHLVPNGSSLKFLTIAQGKADVYPRLGPTMEWDTAAAQIILEESGGKILHFETRKSLTYNKESLLNPNFIAMGKGDIDR